MLYTWLGWPFVYTVCIFIVLMRIAEKFNKRHLKKMTTEAGVGGNMLTSSIGIWPDAHISSVTAAML